jgi:hypothetical protein
MTVQFQPLPAGHDTFDVVELLDKALLSLNKDPWSRTLGVFHPSALGGCKRSLYYDRISLMPMPITSIDMAVIFQLGHANHAWIQAMLKKIDAHFVDEIRAAQPELLIGGHTDGLFTTRGWILEIKTVSQDVYSSLMRPQLDHIWQVHAYMVALGIPRAQILYISRGSGSRRKFVVHFDQKVWDAVLLVMAEVNAAVDVGVPPAKEIDYMQCRECKFAYACRPYEGTKHEHYHSSLARSVQRSSAGGRGGPTRNRFCSNTPPEPPAATTGEAVRTVKDRVKRPARLVPRVARVPDGTADNG